MDIGSGKPYPANALSNFAPHKFILDGVEVNSMEGFLQSLKFKNPDMQREICKKVGREAKAAGANKNWQREGIIYWQGREIDRYGKEYQNLLDKAYNVLFEQSKSFRDSLIATGMATLTHSIGKRKQSDTILTQKEFCSRLIKLRQKALFDKALNK